jgi:hypothetical protein
VTPGTVGNMVWYGIENLENVLYYYKKQNENIFPGSHLEENKW